MGIAIGAGITVGGVLAAGAAATSIATGVMSMTSGKSGGGGGGGQVLETAQGKKAAQVAADQYNMYLTEIKPTEKKFIADVMKPTAELEAQEAGKVNADIAQRSAGYFSNNTPDNLTKTISAPSKSGMDLSSATTQARQMVQEKKIAGMQAITDIGDGKRTQANLGMNSLAADAQKSAVSRVQAESDKTGAILKGVGSIAGAAGALAKNWNSDTDSSWNSFNGTVDNYNANTDYSGSGMGPGPWAPPADIPVTYSA